MEIKKINWKKIGSSVTALALAGTLGYAIGKNQEKNTGLVVMPKYYFNQKNESESNSIYTLSKGYCEIGQNVHGGRINLITLELKFDENGELIGSYSDIFENMIKLKDTPSGIIIKLHDCKLSNIYSALTEVKKIIKKHNIKLPIYYDVDSILESDMYKDDPNVYENNYKMIVTFIEHAVENGMFIGLAGSEDNLERYHQIFIRNDKENVWLDTDILLYNPSEKDNKGYGMIKYDGRYYSYKDYERIIKEYGYNLPENLKETYSTSSEPNATMEETDINSTQNVSTRDFDDVGVLSPKPDISDIQEYNLYTSVPLVSKPKVNFVEVGDSILRGVDEGRYYKGIDVSSFQGKIDWEEVSKNIDFAILRVGRSFYKDENNVVFSSVGGDDWFEYNISECNRLGIPVGVYYYSMAQTEEQNAQEIRYILDAIEGHDITLPVYRDIESTPLNELRSGEIGKENQLKLTENFCETMAAAGYTPGIYIHKNDVSSFDSFNGKYPIWVNGGTYYSYRDEYGQVIAEVEFDEMPYIYEKPGLIYENGGAVSIFQTTESGIASDIGITNGNPNMDFNYADKEFINDLIKQNGNENVRVKR